VLTISGLKGDELIYEEQRKVQNDQLHSLYTSPNIIRMIKDGKMGRACITHRREAVCTEFWWENQKERHHWERRDVHGRMILKLILEK
jgi:hypothetical protein